MEIVRRTLSTIACLAVLLGCMHMTVGLLCTMEGHCPGEPAVSAGCHAPESSVLPADCCTELRSSLQIQARETGPLLLAVPEMAGSGARFLDFARSSRTPVSSPTFLSREPKLFTLFASFLI